MAQQVKNLSAMQKTQEMRVWSLGQEIPWRKKQQPIPAFLPGKFHGQRSLAVYSPQSLKESDTTAHKPSCCSVTKSCLTIVDQSLSIIDPMDCSMPAFPVLHVSRSLLKLMSTESVMPSNQFILCHPLLFLPSIFPSIRVFSNESALCIRWPKDWSVSPATVFPVNIQGWFPLGLTGLILQSKGPQESSPAPQSESINSSMLSLFMVQLSPSRNSTLGYISKEMKILIQKDTHTSTLIAALFKIAMIRKQPKHPSRDEWKKKMWCVYIQVKVKVAQLCPTLCNPMDCSPSGFSVHGILQARILEWVAVPFSRVSY